MKKSLLAAFLFVGCLQTSFAQDDPKGANDTGNKHVDQYVGVQLNGLIRQVFNFNSSTASAIVNPYLLTYNINFKSGFGLRFGAGYNYSSTASDDGITATATKLNDMQLRLGVEKLVVLSQRWTAGGGVDFVFNNNNDNTSNTVHSFDTTTTATKTTITSYGGGPMAWIRYHITKRVLIGTEASFYYVTGTQTNTVDVTTTTNNGFGATTTVTKETVSKPSVSQGTFSSPLVFYLIVKF